jgi:biopolymer transport protein ExbD
MKKLTTILTLLIITTTLCSCQKLIELYFGVGSQAQSTKLTLPKDDNKIKIDDKTYTILMFDNNKNYVYQGSNSEQNVRSGLPSESTSIRKILQAGKNKYGKDFKVFIKATENGSYKSIVDMLDEMSINDIRQYALIEMNVVEKTMEKYAQ